MDRTTQVLKDLRELGFDPAAADPVELCEGEYRVLHTSTSCAGSRDIAVTTGTYRLDQVEGRMLCPNCTERSLWELSPDLQAGAELLEYHDLATEAEVPEDGLAARAALRRTQEPFNAIRSRGKYSRSLRPVVETIQAELTIRYDTLKAHLRSSAVRTELLTECRKQLGTAAQGEGRMVLFTIHRYRPTLVADALYDTVVVSHWERMVGLGNFLLVAPEDVYRWIDEKDVPERWGTLGDQMIPVEDGEDVARLVETVAALWDPKEPSVFSDLAEAVTAARML